MTYIIVFAIVMTISFAVGSFCWTYAINEWLLFLGKTPQIVWWQGGLIGFVPFLGQLSIPIAVLTWILMLFIV